MSKVPFIKNPLTIIGIFCTITEGLCIYALPKLTERNQDIFIWFVIGFPVILLILFFYTLINHHRKLYSPDDFVNKDNEFARLFFEKNPSNKIATATSIKHLKYFEPFILEEFYTAEDNDKNETGERFTIINYIFSELDKKLPKEKMLFFDYEAQSPIFYSFTYVIKDEFLREDAKRGTSYIIFIPAYIEGKLRASLAGYNIEFDDKGNSISNFILRNILNSIN